MLAGTEVGQAVPDNCSRQAQPDLHVYANLTEKTGRYGDTKLPLGHDRRACCSWLPAEGEQLVEKLLGGGDHSCAAAVLRGGEDQVDEVRPMSVLESRKGGILHYAIK
jgi:hypothetical protein